MVTDRLTSFVIAIDGGGTRCRLALDGPHGRFSAETGSANVTTDFDAAIATIGAGLTELAAAASCDPARLAAVPAYLGLAGVTDSLMAARVAAALPLHRARVEDDRRAVLRGALGARDGAIAHFGTGSFFAIQTDGRVRFAGGWGSRLGDEGSAFWVARAALSATLDAVDGLIEHTDLTRSMLAQFGTPGGIVAHAAAATPAEIGALAPEVTSAAARQDPVALHILRSGADHIASVVERLGWRPGMALCLTGGLGPAYGDHLPAQLARALLDPIAPPIEGAVALAHEYAGETSR